MRGVIMLLVALPALARAHPIEPIVVGSPAIVPETWMELGSGWSALRRSDKTLQAVPIELAGGIGLRAELSVETAIDATHGQVGPLEVGGKALLLMEGERGIDLALAAEVGSDQSAGGELLAGRTFVPGLYAVLAAGVEGGNDSVSVHGGAALQWCPVRRLIPTLEARLERTFADAGDQTEALLVPELIYLLDMNHLAIKVGVPVGLAGDTSVGVLVRLDWQGI